LLKRQILKALTAGAAFSAVVIAGMLFTPKSGRADNDNNGAQDEKQMIQIGMSTAISAGLTLNMTGKDPDMVGLGSYLVNVIGDCNGCHTADPSTEYAAGGNPYLLPGANPPFFNGTKKINTKTYLGGGSVFGPLPGVDAAHPVPIISRNLTPDSTGRPEGGNTLSDFIMIIRTGKDTDHAHPSCPSAGPAPCLGFPFNGDLLQVMPWPNFQNLTDRQLTAIYTYLSAVPCLEGGPGEPANRCKPAPAATNH
jgi:hypothetical protein